MSRIVILLIVSALATPAFLRAQAAPSPEAVARGLQQHYVTVRDFSADFTHTYRGGVLRTQTREQGTVKVKKPGRMRWVYTSPERKEFVSDGQRIYSYIPEERQVIVGAVPVTVAVKVTGCPAMTDLGEALTVTALRVSSAVAATSKLEVVRA